MVKVYKHGAILDKRPQRFTLIEFSLVCISHFLYPKYENIGITLVEHNVVTLVDAIQFLRGYGHLWFTTSTHPTSSVVYWMKTDASTTWRTHAHAYHRHPYRFCCIVHRNKCISPSGGLLASVAMHLFCITPNAVDPEPKFSELGHFVAPIRMQINLSTIKHTPLIVEDVRHRTNENGMLPSLSKECS